MSGFFIAGTGTGVGKTFTTCALVQASQKKACKPVISGYGGEDTDTQRLIEAMGDGTVEEVSPWRFAAPLSPDMAAAREGKPIDFEALCEWSCLKAGQGALIEGVGGVMVPLTARHTTMEWMQALGLPVILVTGSYLGTLSHTLTAIEVLRLANLTIEAVIINESADATVPLPDTKRSLERHGLVPVVAQPRVASYREATEIHRLAASWT
jgi:dethiobiotin synthetase